MSGKGDKESTAKIMAFYDLTKQERASLAAKIQEELRGDFLQERWSGAEAYLEDHDTYIRKSAYLGIGRIYRSHPVLRVNIIQMLELLLKAPGFKTRQTVVNAAGEIGKTNFETVRHFFDTGLFDAHHSVRNAVIGSVKKMGEVNPVPVLSWAGEYLHHPDKEIRREICHGIELRGRKFPEDILPMLKELQFDKTARVRNTLVHVLGQIAYKKGCLEKVTNDLKTWENKLLVKEALAEIIDVHYRYRNFSAKTQEQAMEYVKAEYPGFEL